MPDEVKEPKVFKTEQEKLKAIEDFSIEPPDSYSENRDQWENERAKEIEELMSAKVDSNYERGRPLVQKE